MQVPACSAMASEATVDAAPPLLLVKLGGSAVTRKDAFETLSPQYEATMLAVKSAIDARKSRLH